MMRSVLARTVLLLAVAALVPACDDSSDGGGVIAGPAAETEPNDLIGTANYLGAAAGTFARSGVISTPADNDHFSVDVLAGSIVTVDLTSLPADYDLELFDETPAMVNGSSTAGTADEQIIHVAASTGVYTVRVLPAPGISDPDNSYVVTVDVTLPGALHPGFGIAGVVQVNPDSGPFDTFSDGAVDTAGGFMYLVGAVGDGTGTNPVWRIEKRMLSDGALVPGFGTGGVVPSIGDPTASIVGEAMGIAIDTANDRMYVVGTEVSGGGDTNWRFEKRLLSTGALDTTAFGGGTGIWGHSPSFQDDAPADVAIDGTWMYIVGYDESLGAGVRQWRIEKRSMTTALEDAGFGTGGILVSSMSGDDAGAEQIVLDVPNDRMIVVGSSLTGGADLQWQVEKRSLSTGTGDVGFGTNGVFPIDHSPSDEELRSVVLDAAGGFIYLAGDDGQNGGFDRQWRTEKRQLSDGALVGAFGTGGAVLEDAGAGFDFALAAFLDGGDLYVSGLTHVNPPFPGENFQAETRRYDAVTGLPVATWGTGGVITDDPTLLADGLGVLGADATFIYLAGLEGLSFVSPTSDAGWRLEKRTK